jgi:hypothetical protein
MKHAVLNILRIASHNYDAHQWVTLFEQAEKAEMVVKEGGVYTTPHYLPGIRSVTFSANCFDDATLHPAGFYYFRH